MSTAARVIVVGASAGGLSAVQSLLGGVPASVPAAVCVVVHQPEGRASALGDILDRAGPLPATLAEDGQDLHTGRVYVARAGSHLLFDGPRLQLVRGPREHGFRPAIDPLFRTAAASFGPSTVAVVLSGALDDASRGVQAVRRVGGAVVVQDPADAAHPDMPRHAIRAIGVQHVEAVVPAAHLAAAVTAIVDVLPDAVLGEPRQSPAGEQGVGAGGRT